MSEQQVFRGLETPAKRQRTAARLRELRRERDGWAKGMLRESFRHAAANAERDEAIRQRDELRAVLAPLLKHPKQDGSCVFCGVTTLFGGRMHRSDCPALPANRDRLLGRDRAPAEPEAT